MASKSKEVAVKEENTAVAVQIERPSYLTGKESTGTESLGQGDYKVPRIRLLQGLSPEIKSFQGKAFPDNFWHTSANLNLGKEFMFIAALARKRCILFRPRDDNGGGILAFSSDGINWDTGKNQEFIVNKVKGASGPITWRTRENVAKSGLLNFGTSNPADAQSPPAAVMIYEYLARIPGRPDLSPVVVSAMRTAVPNAKGLNTYLLQQAQVKNPSSCLLIRCFAEDQSGNGYQWTIPQFEPAGFASQEDFQAAELMKEQHKDYKSDITQDDLDAGGAPVDDNINY